MADTVDTNRTNLDEIIRCPDKVLYELSKNPIFVSLLTNIPDADLNDPETEKAWNECTNNYNYIDGVIWDTRSFCCVDTRVNMDGGEIKTIIIELLIGVHKANMSLVGTAFKGLSGNRRDNLIREADYQLRHSRDFGIGELQCTGWIEPVSTVNSTNFACKIITYQVSDFANSRNIRRVF